MEHSSTVNICISRTCLLNAGDLIIQNRENNHSMVVFLKKSSILVFL